MNKKLLIVGTVVLLLAVGLSGCNETANDTSRFIGTWKETDDSWWVNFTFLSNGTFFAIERGGMKIYQGTWELKHGNFVMNDETLGESINDYSFSNNDNTLTLIGLDSGISSNLIRQ